MHRVDEGRGPLAQLFFVHSKASLTFFVGNPASDSYSLCVRTRLSPADDRFSPSDSKFHVVDEERLIVCLAKERTSCRLWNNIFVGESFDSLQVNSMT